MRELAIITLWLIALFVGGCGAWFIIQEIFGAIDSYYGSLLFISIPSLIVGILAGWWARRIDKGPPKA